MSDYVPGHRAMSAVSTQGSEADGMRLTARCTCGWFRVDLRNDDEVTEVLMKHVYDVGTRDGSQVTR